ncbi:hypothetical protein BDV95DRAFT_72399 [Massariosphaeria phaeospora]|uniref:Secreted protein n=1 Tax=Massariosphaeria phaeospora TaxID=100035 RepID=A0A7C8I3N3_9PLEO|nr:hypothetical protein BDV95DRAFT_72399 [Massariosphaeria phaeospora]
MQRFSPVLLFLSFMSLHCARASPGVWRRAFFMRWSALCDGVLGAGFSVLCCRTAGGFYPSLRVHQSVRAWVEGGLGDGTYIMVLALFTARMHG